MIINKAKCVFGVDSLDFLGHRISTKGISPLPDKVSAVRNFPRPEDAAGLQRFLGMINFYHRFVPHVAEILRPLYDALKGKPPPKVIDWTPSRDAAFSAAKPSK